MPASTKAPPIPARSCGAKRVTVRSTALLSDVVKCSRGKVRLYTPRPIKVDAPVRKYEHFSLWNEVDAQTYRAHDMACSLRTRLLHSAAVAAQSMQR